MPKAKVAAVGGTFDNLHRGHEALLRSAFEIADRVVVGITSDEFVRNQGKKGIQDINQRIGQVKAFLIMNRLFERASIVVLENPFGPLIDDPAIEALVVSEGTLNRGKEGNAIRMAKGMPAVEIHVIPHVKSADGRPISSSRIRNGEIDAKGNLLGSR